MANLKNLGKAITEKAADLGNDALDFGMAGVAKLEGKTDALGIKAGRVVRKQSGDALWEGVQGARNKFAKAAYDNATTIGTTVGGGAEGLIVGASAGALVGGVAGGIDDDRTFIGGMATGALSGAALGGAVGAGSAFMHKNSGLLENAMNDSEAIAARISKWKAGMGDGISNMRTKANNYGNILDRRVQGVL